MHARTRPAVSLLTRPSSIALLAAQLARHNSVPTQWAGKGVCQHRFAEAGLLCRKPVQPPHLIRLDASSCVINKLPDTPTGQRDQRLQLWARICILRVSKDLHQCTSWVDIAVEGVVTGCCCCRCGVLAGDAGKVLVVHQVLHDGDHSLWCHEVHGDSLYPRICWYDVLLGNAELVQLWQDGLARNEQSSKQL